MGAADKVNRKIIGLGPTTNLGAKPFARAEEKVSRSSGKIFPSTPASVPLEATDPPITARQERNSSMELSDAAKRIRRIRPPGARSQHEIERRRKANPQDSPARSAISAWDRATPQSESAGFAC